MLLSVSLDVRIYEAKISQVKISASEYEALFEKILSAVKDFMP